MTIRELKDFLDLDDIGYSTLPVRGGMIGKYVDYLSDIAVRVPDGTLLLQVLVKLAQVASLNRTKISYLGEDVLCNVYAMVFMPSGAGKDYPLSLIDKVNASYFGRFGSMASEHKELWDAELEAKADVLFKTKSSKDQYKYVQRARIISSEIASATPEGFYATRLELSRANFGGTFVRIPEFADYIMSTNNTNKEFLTSLIEVYETGDSSPKVIKSESDQIGVKGVPSNVLVYSSPFGLIGVNNNRLLNFFNRGGARRFFVCYPEIEHVEIEDFSLIVEETNKRFEVAKKKEMGLKNAVVKVLDRKDNVLHLTDDADYYYQHYFWYCDWLATKEYIGHDGIVSTITSLPRKSMKLAGIIATIEHPERLEVDSDDMTKACRISQYYLQHFLKFYDLAKESDPSAELADYLLKLPPDKWLTTMEIRKQRFVGVNNFSNWFDGAIKDVEEILYSMGYILKTETHGKSGSKYQARSKKAVV